MIPIRAFKDNYIWLLVHPVNRHCAIVDPGDATPVIDYIKKEQLTPVAILITHHHHDHTGGVLELKEKYPNIAVYGPTNDAVQGLDYRLNENDPVVIAPLEAKLRVIDTPGHTKGHIAFYGEGLLFCGDTLFAAGCGRLFEGTASQMAASLAKLSALPDDTAVYCAHEYTAANLRFAATVEPDNIDIKKRIQTVAEQEAQQQPTLPSTMRLEKLTNPFLRCDVSAVIKAAQTETKQPLTDPVSVFQTLRAWKDKF